MRSVFPVRPVPPLSRTSALWLSLVWGAYAALLVVSLVRHEMWRDELHPWAVVRALGRAPDLLTSDLLASYPWVWPNLLAALSHLSGSPLMLQAANGVISLLAAALVLRWAPFPLWVRAGILFSYFFLFEYGVLARNYMAGVLSAVAFCAVWQAALGERAKRWLLALCLIVLSGTSLYGNLLTGALALQWAARELQTGWSRWRTRAAPLGPELLGRLMPLALVGAGMLLSLAQTFMAANPYRDVWHPELADRQLRNVASMFTRGLLPVPAWQMEFWNSAMGSLDARLLLSLLLLGMAVLLLSQWPRLLWLCFLPGLSVMHAVFVMYHPVARHFGHLALLVLCVAWLAALEPRWVSDKPRLRRWSARLWRWRRHLAAVVLSAQVAGAVVALAQDWRHPFSAARQTAQALTTAGLGQGPFAGDADWPAMSVSAYLDQPFYYPRTGFEGRYLGKLPPRNAPLTPQDILARIQAHAAALGQPVLAVLTYPLLEPPPGVDLLMHAGPAIVRSETYWIYRVMPGP